jgi:hypothetical protein
LYVNEIIDFRIVGITSHENDYHICWNINQSLGISLNKLDDLHVYNNKFDVSQDFSLYKYYDEDTMTEYHLISNRCDNGFLLNEIRNIDFILKINGELDDQYLNNLILKIRSIEGITAAFELDPANLKSREKLIF